MKNKVVLLSGGLDSTVLLYDLVAHEDESRIRCIWIDYGQKNAEQELEAVQKLCKKLYIQLKVVSAQHVFDGVKSTLLKGVEGLHTVANDEIPNRNAVLISIAASHCEEESTILVAAHKTGAAYADATPQFYTRMSKAIHWSTNSKVDVEAPYIRMTKKQIVKRAWDMALTQEEIIADTVSCYEGNGCGRCPACLARLEALRGIYI